MSIEITPLFAGFDNPAGTSTTVDALDSTAGTDVVVAWERKHTGFLRGDTDVIVEAICEADVACGWDARQHAYTVPLHVLDRVLVAIEEAGHRVDLKRALW